MTESAFKEQYGKAFQAFVRTSCFTAFLAVLAERNPVKQLGSKKEGDKFHGATMFLGKIEGFQECLDTITALAKPEVVPNKEQEPEYSESEIQA